MADSDNVPQSREEKIKKLGELIKEVRIAMLTTKDDEQGGILRSRPMAVQENEFDGDLWFFTSASSAKMDEVQAEHDVNVSFANPDDQVYVSVSGKGRIVRDREKMKQLWNPFVKTWFPDGLDDPDLALLKVETQQAEYWDAPSGLVVNVVGLVKSTLTGEPPKMGDNEKLNLKEPAAI